MPIGPKGNLMKGVGKPVMGGAEVERYRSLSEQQGHMALPYWAKDWAEFQATHPAWKGYGTGSNYWAQGESKGPRIRKPYKPAYKRTRPIHTGEEPRPPWHVSPLTPFIPISGAKPRYPWSLSFPRRPSGSDVSQSPQYEDFSAMVRGGGVLPGGMPGTSDWDSAGRCSAGELEFCY